VKSAGLLTVRVRSYKLRTGLLILNLALFVVIFVVLIILIDILGFRSWGEGQQAIASITLPLVSALLYLGIGIAVRRLGLNLGFLTKDEHPK
jgi:amino acid permease